MIRDIVAAFACQGSKTDYLGPDGFTVQACIPLVIAVDVDGQHWEMKNELVDADASGRPVFSYSADDARDLAATIERRGFISICRGATWIPMDLQRGREVAKAALALPA